MRLTRSGVPVLVTGVHHARQAILAAAAGAWGIAPYLGRMDDAGRGGLAQVEQMQRILDGGPTRVLAASVRAVDVVHELALLGVHSVTTSPAVAAGMLADDLTDRAVDEFADAARALGHRED